MGRWVTCQSYPRAYTQRPKALRNPRHGVGVARSATSTGLSTSSRVARYLLPLGFPLVVALACGRTIKPPHANPPSFLRAVPALRVRPWTTRPSTAQGYGRPAAGGYAGLPTGSLALLVIYKMTGLLEITNLAGRSATSRRSARGEATGDPPALPGGVRA